MNHTTITYVTAEVQSYVFAENNNIPMLQTGHKRIAGILNQTIDKIIFPKVYPDQDMAFKELGIYGACSKIAIVMIMFTQAFRYAYEPFIFSKDKTTDHRKSYADAMKYFIIFSLLIFLGVMFYRILLSTLYRLLISKGYRLYPYL